MLIYFESSHKISEGDFCETKETRYGSGNITSSKSTHEVALEITPKHPTTQALQLLMSWLRKIQQRMPVHTGTVVRLGQQCESPRGTRPGLRPTDGIPLGALTREMQATLGLVFTTCAQHSGTQSGPIRGSFLPLAHPECIKSCVQTPPHLPGPTSLSHELRPPDPRPAPGLPALSPGTVATADRK